MSTEMAHRVTLSSGKVVLLREMKIKFQNLASAAVGNKAGDNNLLMMTMMQQELLKVLLISIDAKPITGAALEDLDSLFSFTEYGQLNKVVSKLMGGEEGECQTEIVSTGKP